MGNVASKSNQPPLPDNDGPPCASGKEFMKNSSSSSECPIPEEVRNNSKFGVYNVYNQRVDDNPSASSSSTYEREEWFFLRRERWISVSGSLGPEE